MGPDGAISVHIFVCGYGNPPLLLVHSLEDAVAAKGPLRRRSIANSLRISSISPISLEPVFTSSMSSIFPLRASCAFVSNWAIGADGPAHCVSDRTSKQRGEANDTDQNDGAS